MFTTFTALALAGGALRLVLQWQLKTRWGISPWHPPSPGWGPRGPGGTA